MKVGDWMSRAVPTVLPTAPVGEVLFRLLRHDLNGLPVLDEEGRLLGIITLSDIRQRILPTTQDLHEHMEYMTSPDAMEDRYLGIVRLPVSEIMTTGITSVGPDETLLKAGALMNAHRVKQLPVVADGRMIGSITPRDIAWALLAKYHHRT